MNENPFQTGRKVPVTPEQYQKAVDNFNGTEFWSNKRGCKIWSKATTTRGYGRIVVRDETGKRLYFLTHRLAWEIERGEIPAGAFICHRCDNPRCCNVEHFFLGNAVDNFQDMVRKGRNPRGSGNHNAKLVEEQVAEIKWKLLQGRSVAGLAREYGVGANAIGCIKRGLNWKHVQPKEPLAKASGQAAGLDHK